MNTANQQTIDRDFKNWFILQVKTNKDNIIKDHIDKIYKGRIRTLIFSRELIFKRNRAKKKVLTPLFPGYIFIYKDVERVLENLHYYLTCEYIKPLCFKNKRCRTCFTESAPCMVKRDEMELLLRCSDESGVFKISRSIKLEDKYIVIDGPLKYLNSKILWINEKKNKIGIEFYLFNRKMTINLGIDFVTSKDFY